MDTPPEKAPVNETRETIKTLIIAVVFAVIFRSFLFEPFHIPSGSMKSNLLVGDYIFISKYSYGYSKYSFPFALIPFEGRVMKSKPERGDILVFRPPGRPGDNFIKRLIGLPGDHIQMKDGVLNINGTPVKKEYMDDWTDDDLPAADSVLHRYRETLPEGKSYLALYKLHPDPIDDGPEFVVPEGHYFMMGDNRDNSEDSRFNNDDPRFPPGPVGYVPEENLVGRAEFILFSWSCGYPFCPNRFLIGLHK